MLLNAPGRRHMEEGKGRPLLTHLWLLLLISTIWLCAVWRLSVTRKQLQLFNNENERHIQFCGFVGICGGIQIQWHRYYKLLKNTTVHTASLLLIKHRFCLPCEENLHFEPHRLSVKCVYFVLLTAQSYIYIDIYMTEGSVCNTACIQTLQRKQKQGASEMQISCCRPQRIQTTWNLQKGKLIQQALKKKHGSVLWAGQYVFVGFNMVGWAMCSKVGFACCQRTPPLKKYKQINSASLSQRICGKDIL